VLGVKKRKKQKQNDLPLSQYLLHWVVIHKQVNKLARGYYQKSINKLASKDIIKK